MRLATATALLTTSLLAAAAPASAAVVEVGASPEPVTPSCPGKPCFAVSKTTGYQVKAGATRNLYVVPQDGRIVAWTITLAKPNPGQAKFFAEQFGGPASAGISVIRPGRKSYARTMSVSPVQRLERYFGTSVQFPLRESLEVKQGWIVALAVPTWAPSLAVGSGNDTSWRAASRSKGACDDLDTQTPLLKSGGVSRYRCLFRTARLTYSATMITDPVAAKPEPKPKGKPKR